MYRRHSPLWSYAGLLLILFLIIAFLPANRYTIEAYNLTVTQYRVLLFFIELPLVAVWFSAFYGYNRLAQYTKAIEGTETHEGFDNLRRGCAWLAFSLPVPLLLSLLVNSIGSIHRNLHPAAVIFNNYTALLFSLIAFVMIHTASRQLLLQAKTKSSRNGSYTIQLVFTGLGILYCFLTLRHHDFSSLTSTNNPYFLPVWVFVLTIILPNLYAWFAGLLAAYNIGLLARTVQGALYRQALQLVSSGLVLVIVSLVGVQYLRTVVPRTGKLSLNATLLATYIIYMFTLTGFTLMALGAKKLRRIEEV